MITNKNSGWGQAQIGGIPFTTGRVFLVAATDDANNTAIQELFGGYDKRGVQRVFSTYTLALEACVVGYGDVIVASPDFDTAPTATELEEAATKGVTITETGGGDAVARATAALPATTAGALFTVTGKVKLIDIVGEVTTVIQTQANDTKLIANPTVGADVDLCAALDITAGAVGTMYNITGTLASAMVATASGAFVAQAAPVIVAAGTIDLDCAATNTGEVKWVVNYEPIDPGAKIIAA
jgi:hypothetical protein